MEQLKASLPARLQFSKLNPENSSQVSDILRRNLGVFDDVGSVLASSFRRVSNLEKFYGIESDSEYFVLSDRDSGEILGGVGVGALAGLPISEGVGEIRELVIEETYRGCGLGGQLIEQALEHARSVGFSRIYLEITPQMNSARRLFEKYGFRPVSSEAGSSSKNPACDVATYYLLESLK